MIRCLWHIKSLSISAAAPAVRRWLSAVLAMCVLCACAAPQHDSRRVTDPAAYEALPYTQRPYNVFGVWYYPIPNAQGFVEEGRASWYGPGFHGKKTSNGEPYDMHALTAAHKILPLGTLVKVTRTDSGKSVVVRLNDRGPFVDGRVIDLSYSAAHALDMIGSGTAPVRIEAQPGSDTHTGEPLMEPFVEPDSRTSFFTVPVGLYRESAQAEEVRQHLGQNGLAVRILEIDTAEGTRYKVCVGMFQDLIEAQISAAQLREVGYAEACVIGLDPSGSVRSQ